MCINEEENCLYLLVDIHWLVEICHTGAIRWAIGDSSGSNPKDWFVG